MKKYTLKRILTSLFTLLAILLVLFILMQLMPGSPFKMCIRDRFLHGLRDGCGGAFAAQSDRFFCHISRPPLPDGCAGR